MNKTIKKDMGEKDESAEELEKRALKCAREIMDENWLVFDILAKG